MALNCVKLGCTVTIMKYLASIVPSLLNISTKNFNLKQNHVFGIKSPESCRAASKVAYEEYPQKIY